MNYHDVIDFIPLVITYLAGVAITVFFYELYNYFSSRESETIKLYKRRTHTGVSVAFPKNWKYRTTCDISESHNHMVKIRRDRLMALFEEQVVRKNDLADFIRCVPFNFSNHDVEVVVLTLAVRDRLTKDINLVGFELRRPERLDMEV